MALEKFVPPNKPNLVKRLIGGLLPRREEEVKDREFYNGDKTRRWVFYKWDWDEKRSGQINLALDIRVGLSWGLLMKGMMRWKGNESPIYGIGVTGIQESGVETHYYYDSSTGGQKDTLACGDTPWVLRQTK